MLNHTVSICVHLSAAFRELPLQHHARPGIGTASGFSRLEQLHPAQVYQCKVLFAVESSSEYVFTWPLSLLLEISSHSAASPPHLRFPSATDKQQSLIPQIHLLAILHSLLQLCSLPNCANSKVHSQSGSLIVTHALYLVANGECFQSWINY